MTSDSTTIDRIWPQPGLQDLDDEQLLSSYRSAPGQWLRVNFVSSVDGAVSAGGLSAGLSGVADKRVFTLFRRLCDVVLVGAGTVRDEGYGPMRVDADDAQWRRASGRPEQPVFAIVSASLNLDPASEIFTQAPVRAIVVTIGSSPRAKREALAAVADVIVCGHDALDVNVMVEELAARGLGQVLCEGGPTLFGAILAADRVDELCLTVSPLLESGTAGRIVKGDLPAPLGLTLEQVLVSDGTLLLRYLRTSRTPSS
ncbi:pyrimidine reductase family protein [Parafrigoribacterium mesophilum]|uniref:pyrimidine reductase family protein n=1 Tax=Parafrigoribacterium mesophilum TaxID=433646 RepID=UPI0031FD6492